ncbi:HNH endonuclease [Pontixanthobacter aestiaquae]|uniref:HNH endonuclease n=1 Tax=Pontixanthobacter aestiaquae TaxID=1509367 RepID=A0A844Z6C0_9SPHN|nr:HNH endonuclease [Pontixanthobacter aestiaquae]MDN3645645.1 HNH endonuclease [Pontixanthobacter aestiaquae]MXO83358.1 hypothetical protein [Pontixanthobacter aestiaquae]
MMPHVGKRCIFCLRFFAADELTDEHSIPFALGGKSVLPRATCEVCREETSRFETKVLRGAFHAFRFKSGLQSRSKTPPKTLPIFGIDGDEGNRLEIPYDAYPTMLPLPRFRDAAILDNGNVDAAFIAPWVAVDQGQINAIFDSYAIQSFGSMSLDIISFSRMLAKIAHCLAVEAYGLNFTPYLPRMIRCDEQFNFRKYIRSKDNEALTSINPATKHTIQFCRMAIGDYKLLGCRLTLFSNLGAPTYEIVVGDEEGSFDFEPDIECEDIILAPEYRQGMVRADFSKSTTANATSGPTPVPNVLISKK